MKRSYVVGLRKDVIIFLNFFYMENTLENAVLFDINIVLFISSVCGRWSSCYQLFLQIYMD